MSLIALARSIYSDFQSNPDGDNKFIMVYKDHLTKFCILKALVSKQASEVAFHLIDMFTLIDAPLWHIYCKVIMVGSLQV